MFILHAPARPQRSSNTSLLTVSFECTALGARSEFSTLLEFSLDTCRRHLKTRYFQQDFLSLTYLPPCASDSAFADIVCVYIISLTYAYLFT